MYKHTCKNNYDYRNEHFKYIQLRIEPIVPSLPSHIKDSNHFLSILHSLPTPLPSNILLVTIDATSLYTNIPQTQGLSALEKFLSKRPTTLPLISLCPSPTSSLPTTTSLSTPSITFRLRAQPWVPEWPPPMLISSWDPWMGTS